VQGWKLAARSISTKVERIKKNIDSKHRECEIRFKDISSETAFFESNKTILDWIWNTNPHEAHRIIRNKTKVDDSYALCGDWLITSEEFKIWNDSNGVQVLHVCGTGRCWLSHSSQLQLSSNDSWDWENNIMVRPGVLGPCAEC